MSDLTTEQMSVKDHKRRLYELWLAFGNVSFALGNGQDPDGCCELLDELLDKLRSEWE